MGCWKAKLCAIAAAGVFAASAVLLEMRTAADDIQDRHEPVRQHPTPGTPFWFEVIESFNAKYQSDTAGHIGRRGSLSLQPHVLLGYTKLASEYELLPKTFTYEHTPVHSLSKHQFSRSQSRVSGQLPDTEPDGFAQFHLRLDHERCDKRPSGQVPVPRMNRPPRRPP
jgi:hypothetical protein